jgi:hypothetical protein
LEEDTEEDNANAPNNLNNNKLALDIKKPLNELVIKF